MVTEFKLSLISFRTSGHRQGDGRLHFGYIFTSGSSSSGDTIGAIFFVIHPNSWGPFQKRFATSGLTGFIHGTMRLVSGKTGAAAGAAAGALVGSAVPGLGTAIGAAVGYGVADMTDRHTGDYLRFIG